MCDFDKEIMKAAMIILKNTCARSDCDGCPLWDGYCNCSESPCNWEVSEND